MTGIREAVLSTVGSTEGGEEDTGCTHQTPSLATLFNPLTPSTFPLYFLHV